MKKVQLFKEFKELVLKIIILEARRLYGENWNFRGIIKKAFSYVTLYYQTRQI